MTEFHWVLFDSLRTIISQDNIVITQNQPNSYTTSYTVKTKRGRFICVIRCATRLGRDIFDIKVREKWIAYFPREYAQELFERTTDEYVRRQEIALWTQTEHDIMKFLDKIKKKTK